MNYEHVGVSLVLVIVANGAPVVIAKILKTSWNTPIDGGRYFVDGKPWLGNSKTWRGLFVSVITTSLAAALLNIDWQLGVAIASLAMLGDMAASFCKRRMGIVVSGRALFLDQFPESLLPLMVFQKSLELSLIEIFTVVFVFTVIDMGLSPLLYRLRIRKRPY